MANKIMHHMIHGDDTYEIVDKKEREKSSFFDSYTRERILSIYGQKSIFAENDGIHTGLQGAAYNSNSDEYVIALVSSDDTSCMLVRIDMADMLTVKGRKVIGDSLLGHANDITYNENTNKYYVLTGIQSTYKNYVTIVDADTLEVESSIALQPTAIDSSNPCNWVIGYDSDSNLFYTASYTAIQKYDSEFNLISSVNYSPMADTDNEYTPLVQCGCYYSGQLLIVNLSYGNGKAYTHSLCLYDKDTGKLLKNVSMQGYNASDEIEGVFMVGDILYLIGGQMCFTVTKVLPSTKIGAIKDCHPYLTGEVIPSGADLNSYVVPGKYTSTSSNVSATLLNCPYTYSGFSMHVLVIGTDSIRQIIDANYVSHTICITRLFSYDNSTQSFTFKAWENMSNTYIKGADTSIKIKDAIVPGYITSSGKQLDICCILPKVFDASITANNLRFSGTIVIRYNGQYVKDIDGTSTTINTNNCTITFTIATDANTVHMLILRSNGEAWIDNVNNIDVNAQLSGTLTIT